MNGAVRLLQELLGAAAENEGRGLGGRALGEHVVSLGAHLHLLELTAGAQHALVNVVHRGLDLCASGLLNALDVVIGNAAGTEHSAVGEVLSGQIANWKAGQHDIGAELDAAVELLVDDLPLGIDDALVLLGIDADLVMSALRAYFSIVTLAL